MTALLASRDDAVRGVVAVSAVTNLRQLALDSSEIERGYVAQLVGDEPTNEPFYARRSPTAFVDALAPRLLFIHGADDDVVPIAQTRSTVRALRATGRSVELVELPGERHGIGQPDNARRALESEMAFYRS
jgi:dipeptidyl aminopeptidase/acylaminoacyl peptidase